MHGLRLWSCWAVRPACTELGEWVPVEERLHKEHGCGVPEGALGLDLTLVRREHTWAPCAPVFRQLGHITRTPHAQHSPRAKTPKYDHIITPRHPPRHAFHVSRGHTLQHIMLDPHAEFGAKTPKLHAVKAPKPTFSVST